MAIPNMPDPKKLADAIGVFQRELAKGQSKAMNEAARKQLQELAGKFQNASAKCWQCIPRNWPNWSSGKKPSRPGPPHSWTKLPRWKHSWPRWKRPGTHPRRLPGRSKEPLSPVWVSALRAELLDRFGTVPKKNPGGGRGGRSDSDLSRFAPKGPEAPDASKNKGSWQ